MNKAKRIFTDTDKAVFYSYSRFCESQSSNDKWASADRAHFSIMIQTDKACYVNFRITDLREFDDKTGNRVYPEGTYKL